jgi:ketosteroid isomerase-like protein
MRPRGVIEERGDEVLVLVSLAALAKGSRIQVKETMFHSWTMRDGRIARWRAFAEIDEARAAWAADAATRPR